MLTFAVRRAGQITLTLLFLALGTFAVLRAAPGGPAPVLLGTDYWTPEREAELNQTLGLDQPLPIQLWLWGGAILSGDLGFSYFHRRPAGEVVAERIVPTLVLGITAWIASLLLGVGLGTLAAHRRGGLLDRTISACGVLALSTPTFWLGILLIVVFAAWLNVLPSAGLVTIGNEESLADKALHLVLPVMTLAAAHGASLILYTRAAVLDVLGADYVRTAHAKGLAGRAIALGHVLRNAAIPIVTIAGLSLAHLLEGSLVVETVFAWPGIGHLTVSSVARRDYPVLMVIALVVGCVVVATTFVTDIVYRWLDPRLGYQ
jgi:peptide/nickel transport system permease protein